jgi:hypothetical protein
MKYLGIPRPVDMHRGSTYVAILLNNPEADPEEVATQLWRHRGEENRSANRTRYFLAFALRGDRRE